MTRLRPEDIARLKAAGIEEPWMPQDMLRLLDQLDIATEALCRLEPTMREWRGRLPRPVGDGAWMYRSESNVRDIPSRGISVADVDAVLEALSRTGAAKEEW